MTRLVSKATAVETLTTSVTQDEGIASHLSDQPERIGSALKTLTDQQDTKRLITKGIRLSHTEAMLRVLVRVTDLEKNGVVL